MHPFAAAIPSDYIPIGLILLAAVGFGIVQIVLSKFIGPRRSNPIKNAPFECGVDLLGSAKIRFSIKFRYVALLFLLFDVEAIFIFLWAIVYNSPTAFLGEGISFRAFALCEMAVFLAILVVGYIFAWKKGALDWS